MRTLQNALLFIAALSIPAVAADKPNFSGDWAMNLEKSNFGPLPMPTSVTMKITHAEPSITIVTDAKGGLGGDGRNEDFAAAAFAFATSAMVIADGVPTTVISGSSCCRIGS